MRTIKYAPEHRQYFEQLNRAWVEKFFEIEPMDETLLLNPEETILKNGGRIFFVEHDRQIVGTVALIFITDGVYELAKMAVDEAFQGMGVGKLLCSTAIEEAKKLEANKLILYTNSSLKTAIGIYHKFGFKDVSLAGQEYTRADTKMELQLKPKPDSNWFDRKFDFNLRIEQFSGVLGRLKKTSYEIPKITEGISERDLNLKPAEKWSIKEHIGHLGVLEPLWQRRFSEIKENQNGMSQADLENTATENAKFNQYKIDKIIADFQQERVYTIRLLENFNKEDLLKSAYHPRLNQPMRIIDLMYFVAEHDEHHLSAILRIRNSQNWETTSTA